KQLIQSRTVQKTKGDSIELRWRTGRQTLANPCRHRPACPEADNRLVLQHARNHRYVVGALRLNLGSLPLLISINKSTLRFCVRGTWMNTQRFIWRDSPAIFNSRLAESSSRIFIVVSQSGMPVS